MSEDVDAKEIEALALRFMGDYKEWNDKAMAIDEEYGWQSDKANNMVSESYRKLIDNYCLPDHKHNPISYATNSSHDPMKSKTLGFEISGDFAVLKTELSKSEYYKPKYEYHFKNIDGKWYLDEIYLDDDGELLPGL